jgi:hypothetical protein
MWGTNCHLEDMVHALDTEYKLPHALSMNASRPRTIVSGNDPIDFVIQANSNRRDLEPGQRVAIIKNITKSKWSAVAKQNQTLSQGRGQKGLSDLINLNPINTQKEVAKAAGVSTGTVAIAYKTV